MTTFLAHYSADRLLDGAGEQRSGISNFDVTATILNLRLQYIWPDAKIWGANIETRVGFTAYADVSVTRDVQMPAGKVHIEGSKTGSFPSALFAPALLGWHTGNLHQVTGIEVFFPTRSFDTRPAKVNLNTGYWSWAPAYWVTWFPIETIEVSGALVYIFNYKNRDTGYRSGQEVNLDYQIGYAVTPGLQAGISGYLYQQVTDDTAIGRTVDANRGRAVAVGPFFRYHPSADWGLTFKWQHEYLVRNRASGDRFFLQFALKLQ